MNEQILKQIIDLITKHVSTPRMRNDYQFQTDMLARRRARRMATNYEDFLHQKNSFIHESFIHYNFVSDKFTQQLTTVTTNSSNSLRE